MPERSTAPAPAPPARVPGNRWAALEPPEVGATAPTVPVSVVVTPGSDVATLPACLSALASQSYPAHLLQVVVAPTRSAPEVEGADVVVAPAPPGPVTAGLARNRGAEVADGTVLLFLDGGVALDSAAVEAHARWHHVAGDVVTLGSDDAEREMATLEPGVFRALSAANVAMSASTFREAGGFAGRVPPAVDEVEFGYRLFNAGCVFVPEGRAAGRSAGSAPPAASRIPAGSAAGLRLAALVPAPGVRESAPGRSYAVPRTVVHVRVDAEPVAEVGSAVEAVLAGSDHDVTVRVSAPPHHDGLAELADRFLGDARVELAAEASPGWPSAPAYQVWVPPGVLVSPLTVERLAAVLGTGRSGAVHLTVPGGDPAELVVRAATTRALARAARLVGDADPYPVIGQLFGEEWHSGADFGLHRSDRTHVAPTPPAVPPDVPLDPERLLGLLGRAEEQRFNTEQRLTQQLEESEARRRALQDRLDRLRGARDRQRQRLERLEADRERYRRRIERLEADRETLRERLASAQSPPPPRPGLLQRALRLARSPGRLPEAVGRRLGSGRGRQKR